MTAFYAEGLLVQMSHLMAPTLYTLGRETFSLCYRHDVLLGGAPAQRSGIYFKDKPGEQRQQMMILLINNSNNVTTGQGQHSATHVHQEGDNKHLFMTIGLFDAGFTAAAPKLFKLIKDS